MSDTHPRYSVEWADMQFLQFRQGLIGVSEYFDIKYLAGIALAKYTKDITVTLLYDSHVTGSDDLD